MLILRMDDDDERKKRNLDGRTTLLKKISKLRKQVRARAYEREMTSVVRKYPEKRPTENSVARPRCRADTYNRPVQRFIPVLVRIGGRRERQGEPNNYRVSRREGRKNSRGV